MSVEFLSLAENRLAYQRQVARGSQGGIIFLGGYASDMTGSKAGFLAGFCAEKGQNYLRFDYRGCGQSAGKFTDGTIGGWLDDSLAMIDRLTTGPQIVVGSSMGGWLALLLAQARPDRIRAVVGVAAAPDFTEDLVWDHLTEAQRATLLRDGEIYDDNAPPDHRVPMTLRLIEEARAHLVLRQPLPLSCPLRLLQGMNDAEVPWQLAPRIAAHVDQPDTRVTLIKKGDHRLSTPADLALLGETVAAFA